MSKSNVSIKEKLIELSKYLGLSTRQLSVILGKNNEYINKITGDIGTDVLRQIYLKYPQINLMWFITGEGEMLNTDTNNNQDNVSFAELINSYRLDIKELNSRIQELEKEKAILEQELMQAKKLVQAETDVTCANASGFNFAK